MSKKFLIILLLFFAIKLRAQVFITEKKDAGAFPLVTSSQATSIYVDENDDWLVHKAASLLQNDIEMVTGKKPGIISSFSSSQKNIIIIGTINGSATINKLVKEKKLDVDSVKGKWETFKLQTINNPFKEIQNAFVVVGSDKR